MPEPTVHLLLSQSSLRQSVRAALEAAGFATRSWESPEELQAVPDPPAALVIDGGWPNGQAHATCHGLRTGTWSHVPVAWIGGSEDELAALAVGASLFLTTPPDEDELVAHVSALVEEAPGRARLEAALGHWRALELDEAVSEFQAAAGESPGTVLGTWSQYLSGAARLERGDHQVAAEELQALLDERPDFWRAHAQLSRLYRTAGFAWEADDHLRQARELNPALPEDADFEPHPIPEFAVPVPAGEEIELVVADDPAPAEAEAADLDDGRPVVLLADDSELALAMIGDHLEAAGYRVITATDGLEALEKAKQQRPDLVVLDGLMPGKNGFDTCRALKQEVFAGDCPPVLILSAIYTKRKQVHEAVSVFGADDLIAKSTDDAALIEAATKLCPPSVV